MVGVMAPLAPPLEEEVLSELAPKISLPMMLLAQVWARLLGLLLCWLTTGKLFSSWAQLLGFLPLALVELLVQRQATGLVAMASLFLETSQLGLSEGAATVLAAKGGEVFASIRSTCC